VVAPRRPIYAWGVSEPDVRAGDDEREATAGRLAAHFRAGRLTAEELEERTAAAHAALTRGELAELEADLPPVPATATGAGVVDPERRKQVRERFVSAVAISAFLWIIWIATGADGFAWPLIPSGALFLGAVLDLWGGREGRDHRHHRRRPLPPRHGLPPLPPLPGERRRDEE
jgi:Domain of unknown function (DUF1707)